jgi:hypothetical protein
VIRLTLLALVLGIVLTASLMTGVQDVPLVSRVLLVLGLLCLVGSIGVTLWGRPRSPTHQRALR